MGLLILFILIEGFGLEASSLDLQDFAQNQLLVFKKPLWLVGIAISLMVSENLFFDSVDETNKTFYS